MCEVARAKNQHCYPHTGNSGHIWCLSSSLSLSVGFFIGCCPVCTTGGSLPCRRYLLASLTGNEEGDKGLMALRVKPTSTRFPTNILHTPIHHTPLHSIPSVRQPRGSRLLETQHSERLVDEIKAESILFYSSTNREP